MNKPPSILITGANGFTGQHACEYFSKVGYEVIGTTRVNSNLPITIKQKSLDLLDYKEVYNLVENTKPQYVLHLAGKNNVADSWEDPLSTIETNIISTANLIEALHQINPSSKVLIIGSSLQYHPMREKPPHPYSLSKALQSIIARAWSDLYNLHIMEAKPSNLIGPGHSTGVCSFFAKQIVKMEQNKIEPILEVNNSLATRDFLDVRDAIKAYDCILQNGVAGETYDISSGKLHSLEDIIGKFQQMSSIPFSTQSLTNHLNDQQKLVSSNKLIDLGWELEIPLQTSLEHILNFYRKNVK